MGNKKQYPITLNRTQRKLFRNDFKKLCPKGATERTKFSFINVNLHNKKYFALTIEDMVDALDISYQGYRHWVQGGKPHVRKNSQIDPRIADLVKEYRTKYGIAGNKTISKMLFIYEGITVSENIVRRYIRGLKLPKEKPKGKKGRPVGNSGKYIPPNKTTPVNLLYWTTSRNYYKLTEKAKKNKRKPHSGNKFFWNKVEYKNGEFVKLPYNERDRIGFDTIYATDAQEVIERSVGLWFMPIIDLVSRKIIKHCYFIDQGEFGNPINESDKKIIYKTIDDSIKNKNVVFFHSDNWDLYRSPELKNILMRHGVEQSLTDAGTHLQNPTVEGFFGILTRRLELEKKYKTYTVNHMKREIDSFIDNYNKLMDYDNKKNEFLNLTQPNQKFVSDFKKIILEKHDSVDNFFGDVTQIHLLKDYCIIDTETTGLNYDVDEIIEMAAVRVRNNKIVDRFQTLIKPKDAKNNPVEKINHITPEMWKDAPTLTEAYPKFRKFIGDDIVIAYNFYFDNRMITANCSHLGFERTRIDNNKRFDLMRVAKYLTGHNFVRLEEFANRYGIKHSQLHRAMDDCLLEYEVFKKVQEVIGGNNLKKNNIC